MTNPEAIEIIAREVALIAYRCHEALGTREVERIVKTMRDVMDGVAGD